MTCHVARLAPVLALSRSGYRGWNEARTRHQVTPAEGVPERLKRLTCHGALQIPQRIYLTSSIEYWLDGNRFSEEVEQHYEFDAQELHVWALRQDCCFCSRLFHLRSTTEVLVRVPQLSPSHVFR